MITLTTRTKGKAIAPRPLHYTLDALAPHISEKTLALHYEVINKHYLERLNWLKAGTEFSDLTIEEIIIRTAGKDYRIEMFNNAAQAWSHAFYWQCLRPSGGGKPSLALGKVLNDSFGSFDACKKELILAADSLFGNGWIWLVQDDKKIKVLATSNADMPMTDGLKPLMGIDIWEHAYYLDYENRRGDYVQALLEQLINWDFVESNLLK